MAWTPIAELPSRSLPQRGVVCPETVIRLARVRSDIDVDVVWDCNPPFEPESDIVVAARRGTDPLPEWPGGEPIACWAVLERCEDPERWGRINGVFVRDYRLAFHHRDRLTMEPLDEWEIPEAIARRDQSRYLHDREDVYIDRAARASEQRQDAAQETCVGSAMKEAQEKSEDRWGTLVRTPDLIRKEARRINNERERQRDRTSRSVFGVSV